MIASNSAAEPRTHRRSRQNLTWDVAAALLLASSVTMLTDFSRRMLGADPDSLGIVAVSVQAVFTVAATGTFTKAGWQWIESLLPKFKVGLNPQSQWRFALSALVFAIVCPVWIWLPARLASYYNVRGEHLEETNPALALEDLQRSAALNPRLAAAHYNLGELLEKSYQYDVAASHYQQAIVVNNKDLRSYNNLARVLLLDGKAITALDITQHALTIETTDDQAKAALHENQGLAEFELGFNTQAIADANLSESLKPNAASYCLLGKVYTKTGQAAEARASWDEFNKLMGTSDPVQTMAAPDCRLRAEEAHAKN